MVTLIICASVLVHGLMATPLTKLYGRSPGDYEEEFMVRERTSEKTPAWCEISVE